MRRRLVWLLSLPLAAIGWIAGHSMAYTLVRPTRRAPRAAPLRDGYGYLGVAPLIVACAITVLFAGLTLAIGDGVHGRARARVTR